MTNKKKYFRTYIVEFSTSTGVKYYAGQRTSKYPDPKDDPYTGSGDIICHAKKKYGPDCIKSITWTEYQTKEEMNAAEIELILECKQQYGSKCVNIASGGEGGNTREYMSDEQKAEVTAKVGSATKKAMNRPEVKAKVSASQKKACARPEVRERKSAAAKEANARPEVKARRSAAAKEANARPEVKAKISAASKEANARPEVKAKISAGVKEAMRKSPVWHGDLYATLWQTWLDLGRPKYGKFQTHCKKHGITDLPLQQLVKHFNEQPVQVPDVPDNVVPITKNNLMWLEYQDAA